MNKLCAFAITTCMVFTLCGCCAAYKIQGLDAKFRKEIRIEQESVPPAEARPQETSAEEQAQ